ncbi:GNAT family N-acetyltransferase [Erythrobacter rubeus]|uniref:GNAT family N-acetyltransferase n=1 Tax=Erythrobacter rubeus TaxID=2760803 RepID=A0ABR8KRA6_9SPHN|nr:GNAT family N-acetyltransferase [Erythrobacter rubeus]MBD2841608.1 GNAT family N-acetyltransferase [Erythrobacter rubeus]
MPDASTRSAWSEALSRPIWRALTGEQADLAIGTGKALRIDPRYGPFAAASDRSDAAQADLANIVGASPHEIWLVEQEEWPAPSGTRTVRTAPLLQMVAETDERAGEPDPDILPLGEEDVPEMTDLALATEPGPWGELTHRYGQFFGIRRGRALAAMAGERMRPAPGLTEVSGVCTWPQYRGKGMARRLIAHVTQAQRARDETPFLHSYAHNETAIGLYKSLGFAPARKMMVTVLARA